MLIVFALSFVVELAYATYTIFVSRGYRWRAVISSALIALLKMLLVYRVVFSIETLPALVVGQALGTFAIMSFLPNKARTRQGQA